MSRLRHRRGVRARITIMDRIVTIIVTTDYRACTTKSGRNGGGVLLLPATETADDNSSGCLR
jgi:hypothetical protein